MRTGLDHGVSAHLHLMRSRSRFLWVAVVLCLGGSHCLALDPQKTIFQYAGLSCVGSQRIHYRYWLEGYNKEWVDADTRHSAFYTNLKPGPYRFLVQSCNEDGIWSAVAASAEVELLAHFYQTGWFIFLAVAAFLAALFALYAWRLKRLTRKEQELQKARGLLEAKVLERTLELRKEIEQRKRIQAEIESVHRELVEASRRAGQAEVATSVLHNVGNVLNSVNTSASVVAELMRGLPGDGIGKVAGEAARQWGRDAGGGVDAVEDVAQPVQDLVAASGLTPARQ